MTLGDEAAIQYCALLFISIPIKLEFLQYIFESTENLKVEFQDNIEKNIGNPFHF